MVTDLEIVSRPPPLAYEGAYSDGVLMPVNQEALDLAKGLRASPSAIEKVAKSVGEDAARWAFTQWSLRERAEAKFERAEQMLFTREALEQSTHERVAAAHASLFPTGELVADLTVGIGADLIALARRGPTIGFEIDPERASYARHNLGVHGLEAEVREADCLAAKWDFDYALADPARRVEGRRTLSIDQFQPNPNALAERMAQLSLGLIKLSPMLRDSTLRELGVGTRFVSFKGECREALVSTGRSAKPHEGALLVETGGLLESNPEAGLSTVDEPEEYLYEADPAAIRAHALPSVAEASGLKALGDSNGYLTGDAVVASPWLKAYRVLGSNRADFSVTKRRLSELGSGTPIVKSRASVDVAQLARKLRMSGERTLIVAVYPVGRSLRHAILQPLT